MSVRHTLPARLPRPLGRVGWVLVVVGLVIVAGIVVLTGWASSADTRAHQADQSLAALAGPVAQACALGGPAAEQLGKDTCVQAVMARRAQTRAPLIGSTPAPPPPGSPSLALPPTPGATTVFVPGPTVTVTAPPSVITRTVQVPGPTLVVPPSTTPTVVESSPVSTTAEPPASSSAESTAPPAPSSTATGPAETGSSSSPAESAQPTSSTPPEPAPPEPDPLGSLLRMVGL